MLSSLGRTSLRTATRPTGSNKYRVGRHDIIERLTENLDRNYHRKFCRGKIIFETLPTKTYGQFPPRPSNLKINLVNLDPERHSKCQKCDFSNIWFFVYLLCLNFFRCQNLFFTSFEIFPFCDSNQWPLYFPNIDSIGGLTPNPVLINTIKSSELRIWHDHFRSITE